MKKIISIVGVGLGLTLGGCAQVSTGSLESSIAAASGGDFGTFMTQGHNCADNLYHANLHLNEGKRVSGKFMNSGAKEISEGTAHADKATGECAAAEKALSAYVDAKLAPLEARVARLETFHAEQVIQLDGVFFAFNKSNLNAESQAFLNSLYPNLEAKGFPMMEVAGYTDSVGSYDYNIGLSERRAHSVHDYLVSLGVPDDKLSAKGFGPDNPIASNDTDAGRAQNRRVELHIFK